MKTNETGRPGRSVRTLWALSAAAALIMAGALLYLGGMPGLSAQAESLREKTQAALSREATTEGDILDRNGNSITQAQTPGEDGRCVVPEAYSFLVGFNTRSFGSYGLRGRFGEALWDAGKDGKGKTLVLTADNLLQNAAYDALKGEEGSAIVLDNADGAVLALASRAETAFDVNSLNAESMAAYNSHEGFWLANGITDADPPGSVFKIITASAALEAGLDEDALTYCDSGSLQVPGGGEVTNFGGASYGDLDLDSAFCNSVNTYFARLGLKTGNARLEKTMRAFLLGEDIPLDFTTLSSSFSIADSFDLAETSIGQGKTAVTPLQMAMIAQAIADGGVMLRPYLVSRVGGRTCSRRTVLAKPVGKDTAERVLELMKETAAHYDLTAPCGWVGCKTGTAELGDGFNHIYIAVVTPEYTLVLSRNRTTDSSGVLADAASGLLQALYGAA